MSALRADPAKLPLRAAMEAKDLPAVAATFAADAVLRSPLTSKLTFQGREQIAVVMGVVLDVFADLRYIDEVRTGDVAVLVWEAHLGRQRIEGVDHLRLDPAGEIAECTVLFRPLPATAAALRAIGSRLGRRRSRLRGAVISALTAPLAVMTRAGDGVGVRLVKRAL